MQVYLTGPHVCGVAEHEHFPAASTVPVCFVPQLVPLVSEQFVVAPGMEAHLANPPPTCILQLLVPLILVQTSGKRQAQFWSLQPCDWQAPPSTLCISVFVRTDVCMLVLDPAPKRVAVPRNMPTEPDITKLLKLRQIISHS